MAERVYRRPAVEKLTGLSRSTLYQMMAENRFPKPVRVGLRAVAWRESDLTAWLEARETAA